MKDFEMAIPDAVISMRDRFGTLLRQSRPFMVIELLLALVCVALKLVGAIHNPTLLILFIGWLSLWLRRSGWRQIGLGHPQRWCWTLLFGVAIGVAYDAIDILGLLPMLHRITGEAIHVEALGNSMRGNFAALLPYAALVWVFGALTEELTYRGYLFNRVTDLLGVADQPWPPGSYSSVSSSGSYIGRKDAREY
jgi:membrane protease YdiL (CAAX protease family)